MQTKIRRWGNSLGLRIPKAFAAQAGIEAGLNVVLSIEDGGWIVRPWRRPRYDLDELLRRVTDKNVHEEIETGGNVGREVW